MKRWRRIVAGAAAIGGSVLGGGSASASAPAFLLEVTGECTDTIVVTLTPNLSRGMHDIKVDATWFTEWPSAEAQSWISTPIEIEGLHVGATFSLVQGQRMSGYIPSATISELGSTALWRSIRLEITYTYTHVLPDSQTNRVTEVESFAGELDFASCDEPQPPVDQPEVNPPVEEQPTTTTTLAPTTTPAPSTTTPVQAPTSTITVIGQPSPIIESVQANTAPAGFSPVPSPAAQQLPSTGSNTPIMLLAAALAVGSGVALVGATRRR